jgi:hypothetical protein
MILPSELLKEGGPWLSAARTWLQWNKINGSDVIWGSDDAIKPTMTVRDCEELAAAAVAADRMEREAAAIATELFNMKHKENPVG